MRIFANFENVDLLGSGSDNEVKKASRSSRAFSEFEGLIGEFRNGSKIGVLGDDGGGCTRIVGTCKLKDRSSGTSTNREEEMKLSGTGEDIGIVKERDSETG